MLVLTTALLFADVSNRQRGNASWNSTEPKLVDVNASWNVSDEALDGVHESSSAESFKQSSSAESASSSNQSSSANDTRSGSRLHVQFERCKRIVSSKLNSTLHTLGSAGTRARMWAAVSCARTASRATRTGRTVLDATRLQLNAAASAVASRLVAMAERSRRAVAAAPMQARLALAMAARRGCSALASSLRRSRDRFIVSVRRRREALKAGVRTWWRRDREVSRILHRASERRWYRLLRVRRKATKRQLKDAYRRLAKRVHPDKTRDDRAAAAFDTLRDALDLLNDEEQRAR